MNASIMALIASAGVLIFGLYRLWRIIQLASRIRASKTWPLVQAEVTSKEAAERFSRKSSASSFSPVMKYKYFLAGQTCEGVITLAGVYTRAGAEAALAGIGAAIEVRCDPHNPARHVTAFDTVRAIDVVLIVIMLGLAVFLVVKNISS